MLKNNQHPLYTMSDTESSDRTTFDVKVELS